VRVQRWKSVGGLDLAGYYDESRRYFWGMSGLFSLFAFVLDLLAASSGMGVPAGALRAAPTLAITALLFSLAFVRSRRYHAVMVVLRLTFFGWQWSVLRIG